MRDGLIAGIDHTGLVVVRAEEARRVIAAVRAGLPSNVALWVGGPGASDVESIEGVRRISRLEELEQQIALIDFSKPSKR